MYCGFVIDTGLSGGLRSAIFDIDNMDPKKHAEALRADLDRDVEAGVLRMYHGIHYARTRKCVERRIDEDVEYGFRM